MASELTLALAEGTTEGERVRLARVAARRTRREGARVIEVSVRTYDRIEDGTRDLRPSEREALAELYGQDSSFFGASSFEDTATDSARTGPHPLPSVKREGKA